MSGFLKLKKSNCRNCYKCIRNCPVKSIRFSGNQAHIINEECILCGRCFVVCPQDAKEIVDETEKVRVFIQNGDRVYASIAPSFAANYAGSGIGALREALMKLGFAGAEETAVGARFVKDEYDRILREGDRNILISSCCHSVNLLIRKYYPNTLAYLANVISPMQAHCQELKKLGSDVRTVFIGPCVAKKDEADNCDCVDAVLTFEELTEWLQNEGITVEKKTDHDENSKTRLFPTAGGILRTMEKSAKDYAYIAVDGIENCIAALNDIEQGSINRCFIEMSACSGSCIGGPVMEKFHRSPIHDYLSVNAYAGSGDFKTPEPARSELTKAMTFIGTQKNMPTESEIRDTLYQMGKVKASDQLNCGSCGYNTCREKAIAIYQGKAEIGMCLPFLMARSENFSDTIVNNTPNGILVLNEKLEVQQINNAARKIMNIRSASDVLGEQVVRIMDPEIFMKVKTRGENVKNRRVYLAEYERYVDITAIMDKKYHVMVCILRDVTYEENEKKQKELIGRQTIETADRVVDKQMRIVQEIASLLGETAAETKIALTKLKESIKDE